MRALMRLLAVLLAVGLASAAEAQTYWYTPGGSGVNGSVGMCLNASNQAVPCSDPSAVPSPVTSAPYAYTALAGGQYGLAIAGSTALTVPGGATYAVVCAEGAAARYTTDGSAPTGTVGMPLQQNQFVLLTGANVLAAFRAIQQTASATLDVSYYR